MLEIMPAAGLRCPEGVIVRHDRVERRMCKVGVKANLAFSVCLAAFTLIAPTVMAGTTNLPKPSWETRVVSRDVATCQPIADPGVTTIYHVDGDDVYAPLFAHAVDERGSPSDARTHFYSVAAVYSGGNGYDSWSHVTRSSGDNMNHEFGPTLLDVPTSITMNVTYYEKVYAGSTTYCYHQNMIQYALVPP
jgi:hypothetical protein